MRWMAMVLALALSLPGMGNSEPVPPIPRQAFRDARPFRKARIHRPGRNIRRLHRARRKLRRQRFTPPRLLRRAARLSPSRAKELQALNTRITPRWLRARTELHIARMELARALRSPDTSPAELEQILRKVRERDQEIHRIQEETLLELRKTLEGDAFTRLFAPRGP